MIEDYWAFNLIKTETAAFCLNEIAVYQLKMDHYKTNLNLQLISAISLISSKVKLTIIQ